MATEARRQPITIPQRLPVMPIVGLALVGALLAWLAINLVKTPSDFLEITLIGVTLGSVYALIALGYTLVYGILGSFKIDKNGDTTSNPVTIYKIKGGKSTEFKVIVPPLSLVKAA